MKSSKLLLPRFYSTHRNIEKTSKNHYDTLKIAPHATQSEVKSAYYKLTLQYHPDKNKSDYAKQKFQEVSDAYEVLSNHESRKNYDRRMLIRQQPVSNVEKPPPRYRAKTTASNTRIYNFDEWTHAHYEEQLFRSRLRRKQYDHYKTVEKMYEDNVDSNNHIGFVFLVLFVTILAITFRSDPDVPVSKTKRHIEENIEDTN